MEGSIVSNRVTLQTSKVQVSLVKRSQRCQHSAGPEGRRRFCTRQTGVWSSLCSFQPYTLKRVTGPLILCPHMHPLGERQQDARHTQETRITLAVTICYLTGPASVCHLNSQVRANQIQEGRMASTSQNSTTGLWTRP